MDVAREFKPNEMTDSEKLFVLADWFDACHPGSDDEVQRDLRRIAKSLAGLPPSKT